LRSFQINNAAGISALPGEQPFFVGYRFRLLFRWSALSQNIIGIATPISSIAKLNSWATGSKAKIPFKLAVSDDKSLFDKLACRLSGRWFGSRHPMAET
jgi:hypothetical protein